MATTPVELITDPSRATAAISRGISRDGPSPPLRTTQSPMPCATPVRARASPMTNMAAISTMFGLAKPARASFTVMSPVKGNVTIMSRATASERGRLSENIRMAAPSSASTIRRSAFTAHLPFLAPGARRRRSNGSGVGC